MSRLLAILRAIFWCCFRSSEPGDKSSGKYQKVPNQPSLQLAEHAANQGWHEDEFEDFDDNWDDLENPAASAPLTKPPAMNGTASASASVSSPMSSKPIQNRPIAPTTTSLNVAPTVNESTDRPAANYNSGMSLARSKKPEPPAKKPQPIAPPPEESRAPEHDLFSNLGMAPTYKEPEKIKAIPKKPELAGPQSLGSALSQLDSLLEEATASTAPNTGAGGWLDTQLDAGFGLDLSAEIAAVQQEQSHSSSSVRGVFDLDPSSEMDDMSTEIIAAPKSKPKAGHIGTGLGAVSLDNSPDIDVDLDDAF